MKSLLLLVLLLGDQAFALDLNKYSEVTCKLHYYGRTVTAYLDFDLDADPGEERSSKIGQTDSITMNGDKVNVYAKVSRQPLFYVQINAGNEVGEVEVGAADVKFINIMGQGDKAVGVCYFD